jgi:hypothetical protein
MKSLGGALLGIVGLALIALGFLFLIGSGGKSHRYLVAILCLATGAAVVGLGVWLFKRALAQSPDRIEGRLLALAKREDGEISLAEIVALFGVQFRRVSPILERLQDSGVCERQSRNGHPFFVFPQLQQRVLLLRCNFCQAELPQNQKIDTCPKCGGTVSTERKAIAASEETYSMD